MCWHPAKYMWMSASNSHKHMWNGVPAQTLFLMVKLMKLVSTSTWYGGPSWELYWKKSAVDTFSLQTDG